MTLKAIFIIVYLLIGLFLIVKPGTSTKILCGVLGGMLGIVGILKILNYFRLPDYEAMIRKELAIGLSMLLVGFYIIFETEAVAALIPAILGIVMVFEAMSKLQETMDLHRLKSGAWKATLVFAVIVLVLGCIILFNPFKAIETLMLFIGISLIIEATANLVIMIMLAVLSKKKKAEKNEVVLSEGKYKEENVQ